MWKKAKNFVTYLLGEAETLVQMKIIFFSFIHASFLQE